MKKLTTLLIAVCIGIVGCGGGSRKTDGPLFYTALGASDAVGIGANPLSNGYVYRIEEGIEEKGKKVDLVNLGLPGAKTDRILETLENFLRLKVKPGLVTIWAGTNDIIAGEDPEDFEEDLKRIFDRLRENTEAQVFVGDIPDLTRLPRFIAEPMPTVTTERLAAFNKAIYRQAEAFRVPVVKLSKLEVTEELTIDIDGFHPSNEGHRQIASAFLQAILPALELR